MDDTSIKNQWVSYSRYSKGSTAPREGAVRVFRVSPERVSLQLRNENHYMTVPLNAEQTAQVIAALQAGLKEIAVVGERATGGANG